jgi:putative tricarboxylic transport membrane protein
LRGAEHSESFSDGNARMKRYHFIILVVWIALSLFVAVVSYTYGLGGLHNPGPGLMPFLLGLLLFFISLYSLMRSILQKASVDESAQVAKSPIPLLKLGFVMGSLFAYGLLLETLGYMVTTFLVLILLFNAAGFRRWGLLLVFSVLIVSVTYFGFTLLGVRFPKGFLSSV